MKLKNIHIGNAHPAGRTSKKSWATIKTTMHPTPVLGIDAGPVEPLGHESNKHKSGGHRQGI